MKDTIYIYTTIIALVAIIVFGLDSLYRHEVEKTKWSTEWCMHQDLASLGLNEFHLCRKLLFGKYDEKEN